MEVKKGPSMRWPIRSARVALVGIATVLAVAGLLAVLLPARGLMGLPRPPQRPSGSSRLATGLLRARRRLGDGLPYRGLRAWFSPLYRALFLRLSGYSQAVAALTREVVTAEDKVLDLGTGSGDIALEAARLGAQVEGTDSSLKAVERARHLAQRLGLTAAFSHAPATALPYPEESFSVVLSGLLFPSVARSVRQQVLEEVCRVLRPGGRVAFFIGPPELNAFPMPDSQWQRFVERAGFVDVQVVNAQTMFPVLLARKPVPETE